MLLESGNGCGPKQSFYPPATGPSDRGPATALRMQRYAEESLPLAAAAAARSLELAAIRPEAITHLITVSCTGFFAPGLDIGLVKRLGLSPTVARLHVGFMGCHGVLNALRAARADGAGRSGGGRAASAVELCSLHYQYGADVRHAGGQCPLRRRRRGAGRPGFGRSEEPWRLVSSGSYLVPDAEDGMTWKIGDHGFEMTLSSRVPELIWRAPSPLVGRMAGQVGTPLGGNSFVGHPPGGPRILTSVAEALRLPETAIADVGGDPGPAAATCLRPRSCSFCSVFRSKEPGRPAWHWGLGRAWWPKRPCWNDLVIVALGC